MTTLTSISSPSLTAHPRLPNRQGWSRRWWTPTSCLAHHAAVSVIIIDRREVDPLQHGLSARPQNNLWGGSERERLWGRMREVCGGLFACADVDVWHPTTRSETDTQRRAGFIYTGGVLVIFFFVAEIVFCRSCVWMAVTMGLEKSEKRREHLLKSNVGIDTFFFR